MYLYRDSASLSLVHTVLCPFALSQIRMKCDDKIRLLVKHFPISDWTGSFTVLIPFCNVRAIDFIPLDNCFIPSDVVYAPSVTNDYLGIARK